MVTQRRSTMTNNPNLTRIRSFVFKMSAAMLLAFMFLLGSPFVPSNGQAVSAEIFEWNAEAQKNGVYGFLRQIPAYQEKDGKPINFYARKTIWLFGAGEAMLLEWIPQDAGATKFKIRFAYLDEEDVTALALIENDADRDDFIRSKTDGALTQTTSVVFDGQAGIYDRTLAPGADFWLPDILLKRDEFAEILAAKYPTEGDDLPENTDVDLNQPLAIFVVPELRHPFYLRLTLPFRALRL